MAKGRAMTAEGLTTAPGWSFDSAAAAAADRRAPARYLLPVTSAACMLTIGADLDTVLGFAPFCRRLVAVSLSHRDSSGLAQASRAEGCGNAAPMVAAIDRLPFAGGAFDCILAPRNPGPAALGALHSLLKPGGALAILSDRLPPLRFEAAGFVRVRRYASTPSRSDGAEYLSLDDTTGVSFYFRNVARPSTLAEKVKTRAKFLLARFGFARLLFRSFLIVAERGAGPC
jgi:hypothetical protein